MPPDPRWIEFQDFGVSSSGKTRVWVVARKDAGPALGEVKWYGPWRRYAFFPLHMMVFEQDCLRDIADFCERETSQCAGTVVA